MPVNVNCSLVANLCLSILLFFPPFVMLYKWFLFFIIGKLFNGDVKPPITYTQLYCPIFDGSLGIPNPPVKKRSLSTS